VSGFARGGTAWIGATVLLLGGRALLVGADAPEIAAAAQSEAGPRAPRVIVFSGFEWTVKQSTSPVGPGPNVFRDQNVNVDGDGLLHLRIARVDGVWTSAEVISRRSFGHGTYRFHVAPVLLDPCAVLGLFTWDTAATDPAHREIDIEISQWADVASPNAQCVVQPYSRQSHVARFEMPFGYAVHTFTWTPRRVVCRSDLVGLTRAGEFAQAIHEHTFEDGIPIASGENARINLWHLGGQTSLEGREMEVIVTRFEFVAPVSAAASTATSKRSL
jgi:hypothetical protein